MGSLRTIAAVHHQINKAVATPHNAHMECKNVVARDSSEINLLPVLGVRGAPNLDATQAASPRMLLIDEIHNLLSCSARDQRAALNAIKYLANKLRVSIVAAGTYEALHVMRSDPQIATRFKQDELPLWTE
jgi:hypothetical protein